MEFDSNTKVYIQLPKAMIPEDMRDDIHLSFLQDIKKLDTSVKGVVLSCQVSEGRGLISRFTPDCLKQVS